VQRVHPRIQICCVEGRQQHGECFDASRRDDILTRLATKYSNEGTLTGLPLDDRHTQKRT